MTIKKFHRPKTNPQNAKLHAMFRDIALGVGHTEREIKEYMKAEFGPKEIIGVGHRSRVLPKSVSKYNIGECSDMIERCFQVAAESPHDIEWSYDD